MTDSQALSNLQIPHDIIVASDNDPHVKRLIQQNFAVKHWYDDMLQTPVAAMPDKLDLYSCGFPCQPYSSAGRNKGLADDRCAPMAAMLEYIAERKPNMVILESVSNFATKHKAVYKKLMKYLGSLGLYTVHSKLLSTSSYGIPQSRTRIYIVAIKTRLLRLPFKWPTPIRAKPLSVLGAGKIKPSSRVQESIHDCSQRRRTRVTW